MTTTTNGKVSMGPSPSRHAAPPSPTRQSFGRTLWTAWKAYTHRASGYQATLLLSLVYYLVLGPSALLAKATGKRLLDLDTHSRESYWVVRQPSDKTLAAMERQF